MEPNNGLEVDQDLKHSDRSHRIKRIAMIILLLFLAAVIAGFTGNGPVSRYTQGEVGSGAMITTQKYLRYESPLKVEMLVNTMTLGIKDSMLDVSFPNSYINHFRIESILPEPEHVEVSHNRIVFRFIVKDPGEAQRVVFYLLPQSLLKMPEGIVKIEDKKEFHLRHFIYP